MIHDIAILMLAASAAASMLLVSISFSYRNIVARRPKSNRKNDQENEAENLHRRLYELQNSQFSSMPARSSVPARLIERVLKKKEEEDVKG